MLPGVHAITVWSAAATGSLLTATWQGLVIALCVGLCLRLLPQFTAAARSTVWMSAFLLVIALHFDSLFHQGPYRTDHSHLLSHAHAWALPLAAGWGLTIAALWAVLTLTRGVQFALEMVKLVHISRAAIPAPCPDSCAELLRTGRRTAGLYSSTDVSRPSVIGFCSPRILLPPALFATLTSAELEQVLLHEMEHLRRRDDWTNLLQKLVLVFFPLNPVLLWIEHRLCSERELACDDRVLRLGSARKSYAACLTKLAEFSIVKRSAALALGAWEKQSELSRRVQRILFTREAGMGAWATRTISAILITALLGGSAILARSPILVSISNVPVSIEEAPVNGNNTLAETTMEKARLPHAHVEDAVFHPSSANLVFSSMPATAGTLPRAASSTTQLSAAHHQGAVPADVKTAAKKHVRTATAHQANMPRATQAVDTFSKTDTVSTPVDGSSAPHVRQKRRPRWLVFASAEAGAQTLQIGPDEAEPVWPAYAAVPVANGWIVFQL